MNANEALHWMEHDTGIMSCNDKAWPVVLRALRLLAAAEGGEGTPETDAFVSVQFGQMVCSHGELADFARRLERERNGLAARVRELEPDAERYRWMRVQRHADIAACWYLPVLPQDYPVDTPEQRDIAIDAARSK